MVELALDGQQARVRVLVDGRQCRQGGTGIRDLFIKCSTVARTSSPSVKVPVLSHTTSTRASPSIAANSCVSTCFLASRVAPWRRRAREQDETLGHHRSQAGDGTWTAETKLSSRIWAVTKRIAVGIIDSRRIG